MCVVSNIGDSWGRTVPEKHPWINPSPSYPPLSPPAGVTRAEFNALRDEMEELKLLLKAAKRFDEKTGQKDCQMDEKVELIKRLADLVGVDMEDVFG